MKRKIDTKDATIVTDITARMLINTFDNPSQVADWLRENEARIYLQTYDDDPTIYHNYRTKEETAFRGFIEHSEMYKERGITRAQANKLWSLAWDYGHASGYNEVASYLSDLVEIFPVKKGGR